MRMLMGASDIYADGKPASEPNKSTVPHNHPPPTERGRVDMETQLQMAVSPLKREVTPYPNRCVQYVSLIYSHTAN